MAFPTVVDHPTLGSGVYDVATAAYLLGMDERTVVRWSLPTATGKPALVPPSHGWAFSFHDLLSIAVIAVLRQRGVTPNGIRQSIAYLQERFSAPRPFAHEEVVPTLRTAGRSLLSGEIDVSKGGQLAIVETVTTYLRPIEYGDNRLARLWKPARYVALNPEVQAGRPCIKGTRVTTDVIADRLAQGEDAWEIADDLAVTVRATKAAASFEERLQSGRGLALVA